MPVQGTKEEARLGEADIKESSYPYVLTVKTLSSLLTKREPTDQLPRTSKPQLSTGVCPLPLISDPRTSLDLLKSTFGIGVSVCGAYR